MSDNDTMTLEDLANTFDSIPTLGPVEPELEYTIRILSLDFRKQSEKKGDKHYFQAEVEVCGEPAAENMRLFLGFLRNPADPSPEAKRDLQSQKKFMEGFNLDGSVFRNFGPEDKNGCRKCDVAVGATTRAVLGLKNKTDAAKNIIGKENFIEQYMPR